MIVSSDKKPVEVREGGDSGQRGSPSRDWRNTKAVDRPASWRETERKLCLGLSWGMATLLALVFLSPLRTISPPDFPSYYFAGRMVVSGEVSQLYNKEAYQKRWAEIVAQGEDVVPYPNYFIRPAFAAFLSSPFGLLSYRTAWLVALGFNLAVLGVVVWKLPIWFETSRRACDWTLWRPWLAVSMPFLWSIGYAQDTVLLTLLAACSLHLISKQRQTEAGVLLGLCMVKPHLIWALPLVLAWERKHRAVLAFCFTTLALAGISFAAVGVEGVTDWIHLILYEKTDFVPHSMFNIRALWIRFGPAAGLTAVFVTALSFAVILWRGTYPQKISAAIVCALLLSPHTYNQDVSLAMLLPFLNPAFMVRYVVLVPWTYFDPLKDPRNLLTVGLALVYLAVLTAGAVRSHKTGN